jgi:hypothetical protein
MFFLAFVVLATLTTEPPKIVQIYGTLDECVTAKDEKNYPHPSTGPNAPPNPMRYFCLKAMPDA